MQKNFTELSYWDRLDKAIKTLIYKELINNDQEFYEKLEIDKSSASLIRNGKRKIPKSKKHLLQTLFAVNLEFLEKGFPPILLINNNNQSISEGSDPVQYNQKLINTQDKLIELLEKRIQALENEVEKFKKSVR